MTRIGVYPYDCELQYVLSECFHSISNRDLLHALVHEPLCLIRQAVLSKTQNRYVLQEKYRKWVENVEEHIGYWAPMPTWEELCEEEDWCDASGLIDAFFSDEPEWVLYGDDVDIAFSLIDKLPYTIWMDDDLSAVVKMLLELKPDIPELFVVTSGLNAIYVIRSKKIESCGLDLTALPFPDLHAFGDLGNCLEGGSHPTYVLPEDVATGYAEALKIEEERQRQWALGEEERRACLT